MIAKSCCYIAVYSTTYLACLHEHNISGLFGGPALIQLIRTISKSFDCLEKKPLCCWTCKMLFNVYTKRELIYKL